MPTQEIQRESITDDDLGAYRGSWVAIRDRKVIATALDPIELRDNPEVRPDDVFLLVPSAAAGSYLL